jgi:hypothetical protein
LSQTATLRRWAVSIYFAATAARSAVGRPRPTSRRRGESVKWTAFHIHIIGAHHKVRFAMTYRTSSAARPSGCPLQSPCVPPAVPEPSTRPSGRSGVPIATTTSWKSSRASFPAARHQRDDPARSFLTMTLQCFQQELIVIELPEKWHHRQVQTRPTRGRHHGPYWTILSSSAVIHDRCCRPSGLPNRDSS